MSHTVSASYFDGISCFMNGDPIEIRANVTEDMMKKRGSSVKFCQCIDGLPVWQFSSNVFYYEGSYQVSFWGPYEYIDRASFQNLYSALRMAHFWCV